MNRMDRADRIAVYYKKFAAMRVIVLGAVLLIRDADLREGCRSKG